MRRESLPRIPGYRLGRPLGDGGSAIVYSAEHLETGLPVAVKVIAPHAAGIENMGQRFTAEARMLARINHPNVVTVYESGQLSDGSNYLVMELLSGESLGAVLKRHGRFTAAELLVYVKQICLGLRAAHQRGVVHRDLTPRNVLVLSENPLSLKIIDFGIAKDRQGADLTRPHQVLGTPLFISPEQLRSDKAALGPATDIYSLGVMLYWMLAGRPPFKGDVLAEVLAAHLSQIPPPLLEQVPDLSPRVARLVHRCLAKNPADRPESALAVAKSYAEAMMAEQPNLAVADRPGWASFPQLATTEPQSTYHEPGTTETPQPQMSMSLWPFDLDQAEFSQPSVPSATGYDDQPTLSVDRGAQLHQFDPTRVDAAARFELDAAGPRPAGDHQVPGADSHIPLVPVAANGGRPDSADDETVVDPRFADHPTMPLVATGRLVERAPFDMFRDSVDTLHRANTLILRKKQRRPQSSARWRWLWPWPRRQAS